MAELAQQLVSKGDYARLKGRTPQAVSNWIAEGRITREAIIGDGQRARIWVERADADLAANLDPQRQENQPRPIDQTLAPPASVASPAPGMDDLARKRRADADAAEYAAERARRMAEADAGRWIEAEPTRQEWARQLSRFVSDIEVFIANRLAQDIADEFHLDWKQVSVIGRTAYRAFRSDQTERVEGIAAALPVEEDQAPAQEAAE